MPCADLVAAVLDSESGEWECQALDDATVQLISPRYYSDGDAIELLVKALEDELILSDGGEALSRLEMVGVNVDAAGRMKDAWQRVLRANQVDCRRGRIVLRGSIADAGMLIRIMLDALAAVDGLRALAPVPREMRFSDKLVVFLEAEFPQVLPHRELIGQSGSRHRVTAEAGTNERIVAVQAVAGNSPQARRQSVEHAFTIFSDVNGSMPADRKLIVLSNREADWSANQVRLLSSVAFVGSWDARDRFTQFISGNVPKGRVLGDFGEQLASW
jgi:hypothetical protein